MTSITNLVPIRIDEFSSDGAVRVVDTLLLDTACLPISHAHSPHDGNPSPGLSSLDVDGARSDRGSNNFSLSSLIDANAAHLTESILADAEVYGAVRSNSKIFMGGRLDLLADRKLYQAIEKQIRTQLSIALRTEKKDLMVKCGSLSRGATVTPPAPDGTVTSDDNAQISSSAEAVNNQSRIVRIKLRLRQENIVVMDEFDYDVNSSGMEGCDPFSIANSLVSDLKLPPELAPSIASSIVEQIYGVDVSGSLDGFTPDQKRREVPTAFVLDPAREGTSSDFAQIMLSN
mmetsp:Transcript_5236/g.11882  ORF Transcript_5236/g.11882 Transcript_5236/m.11882 type:complete len:288 (+) Transcript_5236:88-951(+)|eukprot:CAMPEP_0172297382 /NCGR_PEP_ID=MMETSP1058-20130122/427_1 /TAXON_ID=83371 /ORGANISM="Detonula confervacea, Strain CCMP 353" /LENGTH=287 /DNA_ID=CAMNT_0013006531 /DNA_START=35 /DNA_END=898 /DNA_ORIENTATION=-